MIYIIQYAHYPVRTCSRTYIHIYKYVYIYIPIKTIGKKTGISMSRHQMFQLFQTFPLYLNKTYVIKVENNICLPSPIVPVHKHKYKHTYMYIDTNISIYPYIIHTDKYIFIYIYIYTHKYHVYMVGVHTYKISAHKHNINICRNSIVNKK